jgi:hypothetical protein
VRSIRRAAGLNGDGGEGDGGEYSAALSQSTGRPVAVAFASRRCCRPPLHSPEEAFPTDGDESGILDLGSLDTESVIRSLATMALMDLKLNSVSEGPEHA